VTKRTKLGRIGEESILRRQLANAAPAQRRADK